MTDLNQIFCGTDVGGKVDRILALTKKLQEIESAFSCIKYNDELLMEIPDVIKTLAAAKDAVVAELKTL